MSSSRKKQQTESETEPGAWGWGSDAIAWALRSLKLRYLTYNPGASYRGLHDSLINVAENDELDMLVCLHEEHAVAIAHGFAKVAERPMAVALHSNVGLMHACMAIYNAWCDRVPIVIVGATGPTNEEQRRPWIDWIHTCQDQASLVRGYVKWDCQPDSVSAAIEAIVRGWQIASRRPHGPVYICLDLGIQESAIGSMQSVPELERFNIGKEPEATTESLDRAAVWLGDAVRPVILAGRVSRSKEVWEERIALAESLGAQVLTDLRVGAAFPTDHALHPFPPGFHLDSRSADLLRQSDLILSLDWLDLGGTLRAAWPEGAPSARIIHASMDEYSVNGWSMNYQQLPPVDLALFGSPDFAVEELLKRLSVVERPEHRREQAAKCQIATRETESFDLCQLALAVASKLEGKQFSLVRLPLGWPSGSINFRDPLDYLGYDGGAGIGSGPGMAIGAALALRGGGRLPVAILGDGDFLMGANAIWTAAKYQIPLLIIIANNRAYYNDVVHQEKVATERQRSLDTKWEGLRIDKPPIDISMIARSQGFDAFGPIDNLAEFSNALEDAIGIVANGGCALLDAVIEAGYVGSVVESESYNGEAEEESDDNVSRY